MNPVGYRFNVGGIECTTMCGGAFTVNASFLLMLEDTILFAANAQVPHIMKNLVLIGVCVMFYVLAPRLCREVSV